MGDMNSVYGSMCVGLPFLQACDQDFIHLKYLLNIRVLNWIEGHNDVYVCKSCDQVGNAFKKEKKKFRNSAHEKEKSNLKGSGQTRNFAEVVVSFDCKL